MTDLLELPDSMRHLERNKAGYVVPWFVDRDADVNGQPDFRVADSRKLADALRFTLCWVCGRRRGVWGSFVVGPMCAVNRTSAEPPCHRDCARYSAQVCPFLANPKMVRRERHLPEDKVDPAGVMILRNPGVALVYTSREFSPFRVANGVLFDMGAPASMEFYAGGRQASIAEIMHSIDTGLPTLAEIAAEEGPDAVAELDRRVAALRATVIAAAGSE